MPRSSPARDASLAALLRAVVGAAAGSAVAACGALVGLARAAAAPPGAPPQAVLGAGGGGIVARYALGFVAAGALLGVLWPLRRRSRAAEAAVGAVAGAVFAALVLPAMHAARPNWPLGAAPPRAPYAWAAEVAFGVLAGALIGWGFPLRRSGEPERRPGGRT